MCSSSNQKTKLFGFKLEEIEYIEVGGNGTIIFHRDFGDSVKIYQTLNKFLMTAPDTIVRIHRKYAVNKNKIEYINHEDRQIYLQGHRGKGGIDIGEVFYGEIEVLIVEGGRESKIV